MGKDSIPKLRQRLLGEFWGLSTYYNPARYSNKLDNLKEYSETVRGQGLKLAVVELAFDRDPFQLDESLCDLLIRRRTRGVMWQKERLLNIGLGYLPDACDKVAWLDCDLLFENRNWVAETAESLESYVAVQPFEIGCWLPEGERWLDQAALIRGNQEGEWLPSMGYTMANVESPREALLDYFQHGHCGFAWAARREVLAKHGFYDSQILGNGDFVMAHAMYGDEDFWAGVTWASDLLSKPLLAHIEAWGRPFHEDVRGSVGWTSGRVLHLWHGKQSDRQYTARLNVLKENDFDPLRDLQLGNSGCWEWASDKPELHAWAADYFHSRREGATTSRAAAT